MHWSSPCSPQSIFTVRWSSPQVQSSLQISEYPLFIVHNYAVLQLHYINFIPQLTVWYSISYSEGVNKNCLPIANTGDCTEGVTVTVIGILDDPPLILTITSINPDDSEPVNCPDANSTINTTHINSA